MKCKYSDKCPNFDKNFEGCVFYDGHYIIYGDEFRPCSIYLKMEKESET